MTSGQRKVHVVLWLVLGPIAVIGLVAAVVMRPGVPVHDGELPGLSEQAETEPPATAEGGGS